MPEAIFGDQETWLEYDILRWPVWILNCWREKPPKSTWRFGRMRSFQYIHTVKRAIFQQSSVLWDVRPWWRWLCAKNGKYTKMSSLTASRCIIAHAPSFLNIVYVCYYVCAWKLNQMPLGIRFSWLKRTVEQSLAYGIRDSRPMFSLD